MKFGIRPKTCYEYKDIVQLENKEQAIEYFSIKLKLDKKELMKLYRVCLICH